MTMTRELRVQAGTQADFTTAATPTVLLRGIEEMTLRPVQDVAMLEDMTLGLAGSSEAVVRSIGASGSFQGWMSYEDLAYWLDNVFGEATPSGGGPYVRTYNAPTTAAPTRRYLSLVKGDPTVGAYQMVGAVGNALTLRFEPGTEARINGDLIGNKLAADALESLSIRDVNPIMGDHLSEITWDAWGGTMGGTALDDCTIRFAELTIQPQLTTKPCFGTKFHNRYTEQMWNGSLRLSLEWNATTKAAVDAIVGGTLTQKQVQLTMGLDANHSLVCKFAGTVSEDFDIFSDDDGVITAELTLTRTYHSTLTTWLQMVLTNQVDDLV
ncbi:MAG: hypothetical protein KDE20_04485 [Caldilineaceae bacterium]|nr:hypothetical protein [Caldilineaceae bacterium]